MLRPPVVDYRQFRFNKLNSPEFSHLKYLLYWPIYGLLFLTVERLWIRDSYFPMYCGWDDHIPFCEYFLIPYLFWFVFLVGMIFYTLFYDIPAFKRMMQYIMLTYTAAIVIYILFPNCQKLRPVSFERDNLLTRFMAGFYQFDTNTNVCPSVHVIGSVAVMLAAWDCRDLQTPFWKISFGIMAFLISISTVFLKQHSILDVIAAIPICCLAYISVYMKRREKKQ